MPSNSKEYQNEYYLKNRDKILASIYIKVKCKICGAEYKKTHLLRHMKSNKCKKNLIDKNESDLKG